MRSESRLLEDATARGGWKLLCVRVLTQAVEDLSQERNVYRAALEKRKLGLRFDARLPISRTELWLEGGRGAVTFEDVCEILGLKPDKAREQIDRYADIRKRERPQYVRW